MPIDDATHWRDASRSPRFFFMDYRAAFPLVLFLLHITWVTFGIAIGFVLFFSILERFRFTIPIFRRWVRTTLSGSHRAVRPWWRS